ncbi:hypothetical protein [Streptomyces sp. NPDC059816]|uniref:hypothetical protein n=1 Tax=Streptomyces sp. NPDC059816 TaxID=3346960 RepID=UPI003660C55E
MSVEPTGAPTLLHVLLEKYGWLPHKVFITRFREAGNEAARKFGDDELRGLDVDETTYRRWRQGTQLPNRQYATVLEHLFGTDVALLCRPESGGRHFPEARRLHARSLGAAHRVDRAIPASSLFLGAPPPGNGGMWFLNAAGDAVFDGTQVATAPAEAAPAVDAVVVGAEDLVHVRAFARAARRGMLVGCLGRRGGDDLFLMDSVAARRAARPAFVRELVIPRAFRLDALTFALVWAVVNLDDWLQADAAALTHERERLQQRPGQEAGLARWAVPDLSSPAAVWLGSHVCAGHAMRHLEDAGGAAQVWSQVSGGSEAAGWLLFRDRHRLLDRILPGGPGTDGALGHLALCLPETAVKAAEVYKRILLLLFAAMLESRGMAVAVSDDTSYAAVDEVVVVPGERAIVGNWLPRGDVVCSAGTVGDRGRVDLYTGVIADTRDRSVIADATGAGRLRALARYLDLDWAWVTGRCREMAAQPLSDLVGPRSHLLDLAGVEQALRTLGAPGQG